MKRYFILLVIAFTTTIAKAQYGDMYSLMYHDLGEYEFNTENMMKQHNGDILISTFVGINSGTPYYPPINVGNVFYKVSSSTHTIIDSLFVEDPEAPYYLFAPNPNGVGNIRANFEYHEDCDDTFLRICHFPDDDLHLNHDEDILVQVCEGIANGPGNNNLVDSRGDLIMKYNKQSSQGGSDVYLARFGSDGILKHQALVFENNQSYWTSPLFEFKNNPLLYYQWQENEANNLTIYVLDSVFQKNNYIINRMLREEQIIIGEDTVLVREFLDITPHTKVVPVGGDDILVAAQYTQDTNYDPLHSGHGVAVAKYDIRTMQQKGLVVFNDNPGIYSDATCLDLIKMKDGTVYFLYKEWGYPDEGLIIVKMDTDLNMEWKRFCKTDNIVIAQESFLFPILFEDDSGEENSIVWNAPGRKTGSDKGLLILFFLNHDGAVGINESGIEVRPYCFYPNPVQSQLQMQFSPDVQPRQIELYDLQGRLVRVQSSGFERVDMSHLPVGTYMMRVTLEDGTVFSDKVVKE